MRWPLRPEQLLTGCFWLCTGLTLVLIGSVKYLPMVDLPQHAAQIAAWQQIDAHNPVFTERFTLNFFTPYLVGYSLTRALAVLMPLRLALKAVIALAILGVPFSTRALLRSVRAPGWLVLLTFPAALGYSFYWGFFNYLVAIPVAIAALTLTYRYARCPSVALGLGLTAASCGLFVCHALIWLFFSVLAASIVLLKSSSARTALLRLIPFVCPAPLVLLWVTHTYQQEPVVRQPLQWGIGLVRLVQLPCQLVGHPVSPLPLGFFLALIGFLAFCKVRPAKDLTRLAPLVGALLAFFLVPFQALGTAFLYARFATFVIPFALLALDLRPAAKRLPWIILLSSVLSLGWLGYLTVQFHRFDQEARQWDRVAQSLPEGQRVLWMPINHDSGALPGPVLLHQGLWYQVDRKGPVDFSFAAFFPELVRFRPELTPPVSFGFEWQPEAFRFEQHAGSYDYLVVRGPKPPLGLACPQPPCRAELLLHQNDYWVYQPRRP